MININNYNDFIFDFDGVIFDTNFIKKEAIYFASKKYLNNSKLENFIKFFLHNSGIPREIKIAKYFNKNTTEKILYDYSSFLSTNLLKANQVPGVLNFIKKLFHEKKNIYILSGGNIDEINNILKNNNMLKFFNNILAGPVDKQSNYEKLRLKNKAIFFGDSIHDYEIAINNKLDFVFVYGFTIQENWKKKLNQNNCLSILKNFYKL